MTSRGRAGALAIAGLMGFSASAAGQQAQQPPSVMELPPLVVDADAVATSAEEAIARKRSAPNATTVIEAEQLNQFGDQPLGDALRRLPGVTFPGGNRARDLQLRAIGAEYTQVLVNGRALVDGASRRSVQVDRIPSSLVERVEIIRAPLASQDGQGAAGTMNIVLKNANMTPRTELGLGAGYLEDNGALGDATMLQAGGAGRVRYVLSGGVQRQRRNESKDILEFEGDGTPDGGEWGTNERKFNQLNLVPSVEIDLGERDVLRFEPSYLYTKEFRDDRSIELLADQQTVRRQEIEDRERVRENLGLLTSWRRELSDRSGVALSLDVQKAREDTERDATRYRADGTVDRSRQRTEDIDLLRIAPSLAFTSRVDGHDLTWGVDGSYATREEDNGEVTNGVAQAANAVRVYGVREKRGNMFAQDVWDLDRKTVLTGGLRLEYSSTETEDFAGTPETASEWFLLPSLHVVHSVLPDTDLRLGVARTLRRPDLRELTPTVQTQSGTLGSPDIGGNPDLVPEAIWGVDTGVDHYFGKGGLVGLNLFARRFDDKIEAVPGLENGRFVSRPQNVGDGRLYGIELEGRLPLAAVGLPAVTLWGNATAVRSRVDTATGDTRRFLDQNDAVANIGLDWHIAAWRTTLGVSANWVSGYDQKAEAADGSFQKSDVDSATRVDFSARTEITDQVSLTVSFLNVLGETEHRTDELFDASGTRTALTKTTEDTYRAVYGRVAWRF